MGKLKRNRRNKTARHNPVSKDGNDSKQQDKDSNTRKSKIVPLIEKLTSSSPNDRSMALGAITVLAEDDRMRQLMLKEKLVPVVMEQCLNDNNDEIIVEAYGLLRNIGIDEGYDIVKYYWRSNIWTSINSALAKIEKSFEFIQKNPTPKEVSKKKREDEKSKQQLLFDFTEHVISLIVVIASGSNDLYDSVFEKIDPVLKFIVNLINFNIETGMLSDKLFNALLDFIYEFSNESNEFIKKLADFNLNLDQLYNYLNPSANILGKSYLQGIKFNVNEVLDLNNDKNDISLQILTSLFENLGGVDLQQIKKALVIDNANDPISNGDKNEQLNDQVTGISEDKQKAQMNLQTLEVVIDITTSVWEFLAINENFNEPTSLKPEVLQLIFKIILPAIVELMEFDTQNNNILLLTDKLIVCLNNLAWLINSLEEIPVEWYDASLKIWDLTISVSNDTNKKDCLNLLWAIVKSLGPEIISKINIEMIQQLIHQGDEYLKEINDKNIDEYHIETLTSLIGFTGNIAIIINNTEITFEISEFLMKTIELLLSNHQQNPKIIDVLIETINIIFDIFGDASFPYDFDIYVTKNYNERLQTFNAAFKDIYKKIDKNKYGDLKIRGEETWNNLGRFIDYKRKERS